MSRNREQIACAVSSYLSEWLKSGDSFSIDVDKYDKDYMHIYDKKAYVFIEVYRHHEIQNLYIRGIGKLLFGTVPYDRVKFDPKLSISRSDDLELIQLFDSIIEKNNVNQKQLKEVHKIMDSTFKKKATKIEPTRREPDIQTF